MPRKRDSWRFFKRLIRFLTMTAMKMIYVKKKIPTPMRGSLSIINNLKWRQPFRRKFMDVCPRTGQKSEKTGKSGSGMSYCEGPGRQLAPAG